MVPFMRGLLKFDRLAILFVFLFLFTKWTFDFNLMVIE